MALPPSVELLNPTMPRGPFRVAVFDFDGTLSLIREGWSKVMANLGIQLLRQQNLTLEDNLAGHLERQMLLLSGKPSIVQMQKLSSEVAVRGGTAPDPQLLLKEFLRRLYSITDLRSERLRSGDDAKESWAVPGCYAVLDSLREQGIRVILASGTDRSFVHSEAALLKMTEYFGAEIYAPDDNSANFNKRDVFDAIVNGDIRGEEIVSFGDGYAETVEAKRIGAAVIGLATNEVGNSSVNAMKRKMLAELGADIVIPDYRDGVALLEWLRRMR